MTKEEKLERINEMKQLYFSSDLKLAMIHPQIYNITQIDFIDNVNIKDGICEYVSIYSAYQNMFKNGIQDIIDIINLTDNKDMKGSEVVQTINNFLSKPLFEYHIIENDLKDKSRKNMVGLQKMVDNLIHNQSCLPLGYYPALLNVKGHMVNVLGQDDNYYYYVENGYEKILYNDTLMCCSLDLLHDIVVLDDYKNSKYYERDLELDFKNLKEHELELFGKTVDDRIHKVIQKKLTNKFYKSSFISTVYKKYFYSNFAYYYNVTCRARTTQFDSMIDRLTTYSVRPNGYKSRRDRDYHQLVDICTQGNIPYTSKQLNDFLTSLYKKCNIKE